MILNAFKFVADQFGQSLNSVRDAEANPASSSDARNESALNKPAADKRPAESIGEQPVNEPEPAIKPLAAGNLMDRALFAEDSTLRQYNLMDYLVKKLRPKTSSGASPSMPLVEDEARLSKAFKQQEALEKQAASSAESPVNSKADSKSTSTTTSTTPSTTTTSTTTTTPMHPTSTMSQEEVKQEKIFKEFFGSRDGSGGSSNSNLNLLLSAFKSKLGFGKPIAPAVLKQNIQSELASLHATSTPAPVLSLPIAAAPIALAPVIVTPLPPLATAEGSSVSSPLSHPGHISYDEAKKTIASSYALEKPAGYVEPLSNYLA